MTTIEPTAVRLPMAELGPESPLPPLPKALDVHATVPRDGVPDEVAGNMHYGFPASMLPYTIQDGYGRDRRDGNLDAIVMDNGLLRATILPGLGGRLWSLVDLTADRELLYRNPVLQPANLALRNAWFSGGVEWNLGTTGHTALTCAPMHAAQLDGPDGPILRLWEFERSREVTYQLDFSLPPGSSHLYVAVRIVNPNPHTVPMYWWSNIAVPDTEGNRVIVPADDAYRFSYERRLSLVPTPVHDGFDYSYCGNAPHAADYFFRSTDADRPWIAAVDASGKGLVQTSTARLYGRKLFVWGTGAGGRRWQDWLTEPGTTGYLEIQAGLAHTQLEHLPMPAESSWSWLETYGPVDVPDRLAHHRDWDVARAAVAGLLDEQVPAAVLEERRQAWQPWFDRPVQRRLHHGSNWGALERERREMSGEAPIERPGTPYGVPDGSDPETADWLVLLRSGRMPTRDGASAISGYATSPGWRRLLEATPPDWYSLYLMGLCAVAAGDTDDALEAWTASLEHAPTAWAHRAIAHTWRRRAQDPAGAHDDALAQRSAAHYREAVALGPGVWQLVAEACDALFAVDADAEVLELLATTELNHGQLTMRRIKALTRLNRLDEAQAIFDEGFEVANLREGEETLDTLWFALAQRRAFGARSVTDAEKAEARRMFPLPARYNFRMTPG